MDKEETGTVGDISESELAGLLASLKVDPAPESDFEARFLYDLRERLARESVCCPARRLLWDHILQMLANFGPRKLAYSASTLGLGALAVGFFTMPEEVAPAGAPAVATTSPLSRLEHSLAALRPNSGHEACTTITICEQKKKPYTEASLASGLLAPLFGRGTTGSVESFPVNMGLDSYVGDDFPSYTTSSGF